MRLAYGCDGKEKRISLEGPFGLVQGGKTYRPKL